MDRNEKPAGREKIFDRLRVNSRTICRKAVGNMGRSDDFAVDSCKVQQPPRHNETDGALAQKAADLMAEATALESRLHLPGVRDDYRAQLEHIVLLATRALGNALESQEIASLQWVLLRAQAARAEDARYGAGQLSRGSQRAPTLEDCEDGWQRVEQIICNAEGSALEAARLARLLNTAKAGEIARRAEVAGKAARKIVIERNRAYTFHADPGFSFGEGWYLAAAALLAGVPIQIKSGAAQELQAKRFLLDAGLGGSLRPYRPRPASPKHLTHLIAEAFHADAPGAQCTLRTAFLGGESPSASLSSWIAGNVGANSQQKVLLWVRTGDHDVERNTCFDELHQLSELVLNAGFTPIFFGDAVPAALIPTSGVDLTLCWKEPLFQGPDMRRAQLHLFEELRCRHGLVGQIGVTTAGMDGPALMGLPALYLTQESNVRLGKWVGVVPGYQEVVRAPGYFEVIRATLHQWQQ